VENGEVLRHLADICMAVSILHHTEGTSVDQVTGQNKKTFLPVHISDAYKQMVKSISNFSK